MITALRGIGSKLASAMSSIAVMSASAFAQMDTAYVPFVVNVDATVTAVQDGKTVSMPVTANQEKILKLPLPKTTGLNSGGTQKTLNAPLVTGSRGNITLRLPPQAYQNAEIALYSVNGKRVMRGNADAEHTANGLARKNLAAGAYTLSVKGINGNAFTTRLIHNGGNLNINAAFGSESVPRDRRTAKKADAAEEWEITVHATTAVYIDTSYALRPVEYVNPTQNITLRLIVLGITFDANGGSGTVPVQTAQFGVPVTLPDGSGLTRSGYTFGGWNTKNDGTGDNYNAGSTYTTTADVTLYAKWNVQQANTYAITFNANGGSGTVPGQNVQAGISVTLPDGSGLTRSGYTFGGWNTKNDGTGDNYNGGSPYTPTADVMLYAKWNANICTITFNTNGGSGTAPNATTVYAGTAVTLPDGSGLAMGGYVFGGWNTKNDGTGTNYSAGAPYTPIESVILYAKWTNVPVEPPSIGTFDDERDGKTYRKITIGTQTWMAENLNYKLTNRTFGDTGVCYGNKRDSCARYGRLYHWAAAMSVTAPYNERRLGGSQNYSGVNHQGICPAGWRIPSNADWTRLFSYADGTTGNGDLYSSPTAGTKLKSPQYWISYSGYPTGTDEFGFSALPGGYVGSNGAFQSVGEFGVWWSAAEGGDFDAYYRAMEDYVEKASVGKLWKTCKLSVRCVQD